MGQKVNPIAFRTGIMIGWKSRWYASEAGIRRSADRRPQDPRLREESQGQVRQAALSGDRQDRNRAHPRRSQGDPLLAPGRGLLIGRKGERVEELQKELQEKTGRRINIKIEEINRPEVVAQLVAEDIAEQLIKRSGFRRMMKRAIEQTMEAGAKGIKIQLSGRLGGAEMSRREKQIAGSIPLVHPAGEDRLRLRRSEDRPGPHRHPGLDQSRHV